MSQQFSRIRLLFLAVCILSISGIAGCDNDGAIPITENEIGNDEIRIIKIGNITDITGPGAVGMELVNTALADAVRYYNDNNLIDGLEFEIITWDGQMDSARTIPGYEFLRHKQVDLMTTPAPGVAITLLPRLESDQQVLFAMVGELDSIQPPGYVFSLGTIPQYEAYTLLSWIAQNDWDYRKYGPAKIGGAAWKESYSSSFLQAMEEYAHAHPEQFEYVGGFLTEFSFSWSSQAESLKDCDYIFPNIMMNTQVQELRSIGSNAKFIGGTPHTAIQNQFNSQESWSQIDEMLITYTGFWWSETGEEINQIKNLLNKYHLNSAQDIMSRGSGYQSVDLYLKMLEITANAIQNVGIEDFDSQSLYRAAESYSKSVDGRDMYSFTPTKRFIVNELGILEVDAAKRTLVRNDPSWYPVMTGP